jgi:IclR helix-turn-helix domain
MRDKAAMASPGLAYWRAAIEGRKDVDPAAAALMIAQPRFAEACWTSVAFALQRYGRNPIMTRVAKDISRLFYGYLVIYLGARDAITLTAIRDICNEIGLASRGRAQAILFHLRAIGYLKPDPDHTDGRSRRYVPSAEMQSALRQVITDELRAFSVIEPEAGRAADRFDEPDFYKAFLLRFGEGIVDAMKIKPVRIVSLFAERNAGTLILCDIMDSAERRDVYPPRGTLKMSVTDLAEKFDVSRSHVFRLLRDAEKQGLLKRNADEQTGTIDEILACDIVEFQVISFMALAHCCQHAFEATDANVAAAG